MTCVSDSTLVRSTRALAGVLAAALSVGLAACSPAAPPNPPPRPIRAVLGPIIPEDGPAERGELSLPELIRQVLARSPTLAQMTAAWQAASTRYPQVTSLDDPMFEGTIGPGTFAPDDRGVEFAYRLEIAQKIPFPGKRRLRGQNALAEASAAGHDVDDTRLQLVASTQDAFYEYYLMDRALAVNQRGLDLLERYRKIAQDRYESGVKEVRAPLQDVLQTKVEIGRQQERRLTLERMRLVAVARINTLLHQPPDCPLPPPPGQLAIADELPDAAALRVAALANRPDLKALADHLAAEKASLLLAYKEYYPDFEPFFMYDRFMGNMSDNRDLASMIGIRMNLPVYQAKRSAAVAEAEARVRQRRAELDRQIDQVNFQVQEAYDEVRERGRIVRLYTETILRAARENVEAAEDAYRSAKVPSLALIEAQRSLVDLEDRYYEAVADYFRRRAALERAIGGPLGGAAPSRPAPGR
jgi:outer membrane protein TolC